LCRRTSYLDCRRINYFINDNVEHVYRGGVHDLVMGGLNISIRDIVESIDVEGESCMDNRGIKYIYTIYCRI